MKKKSIGRRVKSVDEKYLGSEPILNENYTQAELIRAYNWYNYFYNRNDVKPSIISYMKKNSFNKNIINKFQKVDPKTIPNYLGWNCKLISNGSILPKEQIENEINKLIETHKPKKQEVIETKPTVNIQERIKEKTYDLIADIEEQIDNFFDNQTTNFDIKSWLIHKDVKPAISEKIAQYYKPLYAELYDLSKNPDDQLKEAYKHIKKPNLKKITEFVKDIIAQTELRATAIKNNRKPRKKKEKPASVLVSKLKYLEKDQNLNVTSQNPVNIIGANQVWIFNVKYKKITVLNAIGPAGLSVKGTTITGFDENTSKTKVLRKPEQLLNNVVSGGKITLRKFMEQIKTKEQSAKGRTNSETIILRTIK